MTVATMLQARYQRSSGLYQMFGELCDAVILTPSQLVFMEEVPVRFIANAGAPVAEMLLITMHMDYGHAGHAGGADNSFATHEAGRAHYSQFLHPVFRAHTVDAAEELPKQRGEFHIIEDFLATWDHAPLHFDPLVAWLERVIGGDYTSQEEQLQQRRAELRATLSDEELRQGAVRHDDYFGD